MAEIDYAAMFAAEEERVSQEAIKPARKSRESKEDSHVINLTGRPNEGSHTIKGYFVTDASGKYMYYPRKINSIAMIGLDSKEFGTFGFRCMDPKDYVVSENGGPGITAEQLNKIKTFRNNYYAIRDTGKLLSVVEDKSPEKKNKNYLMNGNYFMFYMYVTEFSDNPNLKPGIYQIKTKSAKFNEQKTEFIKSTQKTMARFSPAAVQQFMENLANNNSAKTELVTITYTQNAGYDFKFSTDVIDPPFQIPEADLATLQDLDTQYISKYEVDEETLNKTLAAMKIITDRIDELNAKSKVATTSDPMTD